MDLGLACICPKGRAFGAGYFTEDSFSDGLIIGGSVWLGLTEVLEYFSIERAQYCFKSVGFLTNGELE